MNLKIYKIKCLKKQPVSIKNQLIVIKYKITS